MTDDQETVRHSVQCSAVEVMSFDEHEPRPQPIVSLPRFLSHNFCCIQALLAAGSIAVGRTLAKV
jgi:hypothetical protein